MSLSNWSKKISSYYPISAFQCIPNNFRIDQNELHDFIQLYYFEHIPHFINEQPMAYATIRKYIANALNINPLDIYLTGSAKLGFSLNPKHFLKPYSQRSDLDYFIVSSTLFEELSSDLQQYIHDVATDSIKKVNAHDELVRNSERKGFIDIWKMYPSAKVKHCQMVAHKSCSLINKLAGQQVTSPQRNYTSIRCFKTKDLAIKQLTINLKASIQCAQNNYQCLNS